MNAYDRHKKLVNDYLLYYSRGKTLKEVFKRDRLVFFFDKAFIFEPETKYIIKKSSKDKTDLDVIRQEMKFVWDESDTADTWEKRLAKRYYDKLFKEYCICDLSYYKINKIAMRWRIEKEVVEGKGQFICGEKKCTVRDGLRSWEGSSFHP